MQDPKIIVDQTIPMWAVISSCLTCLGVAAWSFIKMYFQSKSHDERMTSLESDFKELDKDVTASISDHKDTTDKKISEVSAEIKSTRDILIEVKTMCTLLIGDRIKKPE